MKYSAILLAVAIPLFGGCSRQQSDSGDVTAAASAPTVTTPPAVSEEDKEEFVTLAGKNFGVHHRLTLDNNAGSRKADADEFLATVTQIVERTADGKEPYDQIIAAVDTTRLSAVEGLKGAEGILSFLGRNRSLLPQDGAVKLFMDSYTRAFEGYDTIEPDSANAEFMKVYKKLKRSTISDI